MKTVCYKKCTQTICTILMILVLTSTALAYPPDNAAVLYYRASLLYDANDAMMDKVMKFIKGDAEIDDEIRKYVETNKNAIKSFVDAGDAPNCDWGLDYSEGMAMVMPPFAPLRNVARIVRAQGKITTKSGDYNRALDLCLSLHKAGNHVAASGNLIFHLVGISLDAMANQGIADILGEMSDNPEILIRLRGQVYEVTGKFPSLTVSLNRDMNTCMQDMTKERVEQILDSSEDFASKEKAKIIRRADEKFFRANKEYFLSHQAALLSAIELPYPQSYEQLVRLKEKLGSDSKNNPNAILTEIFVPAIDRVLCLDIRIKTHFNALKTAIEIYVIKAKTGKLPDVLPDGLPGDLFSGKPFKYEKNADGFILSCQGKDLSKDEIYKYEFNVKQ
jgi:hypothetical protein